MSSKEYLDIAFGNLGDPGVRQ